MPFPNDFLQMLTVMVKHQAEFIVIGGVCGVLHGSTLATKDLDIVHHRTEENLSRLLTALQELHAYYRGRGGQRLAPRKEWLAADGPNLLRTRLGDLELGTVSPSRGYDELLPHTELFPITEEVKVPILDLPTLIQVKQEAGRDKDKLAVIMLKATLAEKQKRQLRSPSE